MVGYVLCYKTPGVAQSQGVEPKWASQRLFSAPELILIKLLSLSCSLGQ
jgi:hypothetical protein